MSVRMKLCDTHQLIINGVKEVTVDGKTVKECLANLIEKYPSLEPYIYDRKDELSIALTLFVNGESIQHEETDKPVKDGDEVYPLVVIGG